MKKKPFGQGTAGLVLIGSAAVLSGCMSEPDPLDIPEVLNHPVYKTLEDCVGDWGQKELCEPATAENSLDPAKRMELMANSEFNTVGMDAPVPADAASAPVANIAPGATGATASPGHAGGFIYPGYFYGPYYSSSGYAYRYDGTRQQLSQMPARQIGVSSHIASPNQLYAFAGGEYQKTAPAAGALSAKTQSQSNKAAIISSKNASKGSVGGSASSRSASKGGFGFSGGARGGGG